MFVGVVLIGLSATAASPDADHVALDLFFFGQRDPALGVIAPGGVAVRSGNPVRDEAFDYGAASVDFSIGVTDNVAVQGNGALGWIQDRGGSPIPRTLTGAEVISASPDLLTLDTSFAVAWRPGGGPWRITPGVYYHHQTRYYVGGPNLDVARSLFDDNTTLFLSTTFRGALIRQLAWDGQLRRAEKQFTYSALLGWTQIWSPSWLTSLSVQYVRQSGLLSSPNNFVALYDRTGTVVSLVDEALPRIRHRVQLNARVRYAPAVGWSLGFDGSFYADRWGLEHGGLEASVEIPVFASSRIRAWYRLSAQNGVRYFVEAPLAVDRFHTQDSDLGSFVMHSPGALVTFPAGSAAGLDYEARVALYGFSRSDGLLAVGGHAGLRASW